MSAPTSRVEGAAAALAPAPPIGVSSASGGYAWMRAPPRTAGIRRRTAAFAVDLAVVFVLAWAFTFVAAAAGLLRIPDIAILGRDSDVAGLLWIVSVFELPVTLVYFVVLEVSAGRTLGKLLLGLRVRRADGGRPSLFESFLRNLLRLLWITPLGPAFVVLDLWSLRVTELDQRLGDLAAETVVLDARA